MAMHWAFSASIAFAALAVATPMPSYSNSTTASEAQPAVTETTLPAPSTLATLVPVVQFSQGMLDRKPFFPGNTESHTFPIYRWPRCTRVPLPGLASERQILVGPFLGPVSDQRRRRMGHI